MFTVHPTLSTQLVHDRQRELRRAADASRVRRAVREHERTARHRPSRQST